MLRFSSTVRSMSLVMACGMTPMHCRASSGSFSTSKPLMMARPLVMGSNVVIMRMSVDLPAPLGPSRPKISPCFTAKETSSTAVKSPYILVMWSTTMASPLVGATHPLVFGLGVNQLTDRDLSADCEADVLRPSYQERARHRGCRL